MAKSQVHKRGPATPQMNMTPLIDVTFLLIIFFMLINNIITEQTVPMFVPDLEDPETRQPQGQMEKIVINMAPIEYVLPGQYRIKDRQSSPLMGVNREKAGALKIGLVEYRLQGPKSVPFDVALRGILTQLEKAKAANPQVEVELRADCALYYDQVQSVMGAISQANVNTIHLVAYLPEDQRRRPMQ